MVQERCKKNFLQRTLTKGFQCQYLAQNGRRNAIPGHRPFRELVLRHRAKAAAATFTLPVPPSTNALFRNLPRRPAVAGKKQPPGRARTKAYDTWLKTALQQLVVQKVPLIEGEISVTLVVPRGADLDNQLKAILDSLTKAYVIEDDSKIGHLNVAWHHNDTVDHCVVNVQKLNHAEGEKNGG